MTEAPRSILVPTDFSPASDSALALAKELGQRLGAELHVLHARMVVDEPHVDTDLLDEIEQILASSDDQRRAALEEEDSEESSGFHGHVIRGIRPADVILDAIDEYHCGLVVMGSHGRRGLRRLFMGSVAEEVVRRAPVPVLTTRAETSGRTTPQRILVGVDFSDASLEAVRWAAAIAAGSAAEIRLLHVVQPAVYPGLYGVSTLSERDRDRVLGRCREALTDLADSELDGLPYTTVVVEAQVAEGIVEHAAENDFDLVVVATRGRSGVSRALLGSDAERVVRLSRVPVLTVRGDGTEEAQLRSEEVVSRDVPHGVESPPQRPVVRC